MYKYSVTTLKQPSLPRFTPSFFPSSLVGYPSAWRGCACFYLGADVEPVPGPTVAARRFAKHLYQSFSGYDW